MTLSVAPQTRAACSATASSTAWRLPGALASARRIRMVAASCSRMPAGPGVGGVRGLRAARDVGFWRDAMHPPPAGDWCGDSITSTGRAGVAAGDLDAWVTAQRKYLTR